MLTADITTNGNIPGGAGENVSADQRVLSGEHMPELEHHPVPPAPAGWRNWTLATPLKAPVAVLITSRCHCWQPPAP
jgi:hypothetical protein